MLTHPDGLNILGQVGKFLQGCTKALQCKRERADSRVCRTTARSIHAPQAYKIAPGEWSSQGTRAQHASWHSMCDMPTAGTHWQVNCEEVSAARYVYLPG